MKILEVAPRFYVEGASSRRWTGLDYVVAQIAIGLGGRNEVSAISPWRYDGEKELGGCVRILYPGNAIDYFCSLTSYLVKQDFINSIQRDGFVSALKLARIKGFRKGFERMLIECQPDVVHIHGSADWSFDCLRSAVDQGFKCLVTLHGVNKTNPMCSEAIVRTEREMLRYILRHEIKISVVSSGTQKAVQDIMGIKSTESMQVIPNSTFIQPCGLSMEEARREIGINVDGELIVCVGTIGETKNQKTLIDAISSMSESRRSSLTVLLIGYDTYPGGIESYIKEKQVEGVVRSVGFISIDQVSKYYRAANLNIVVSKSEGFGMSVIEAMLNGTPTLMEASGDAASDFSSLYSVQIVRSSSPKMLASAIASALEDELDRGRVAREAALFSPDSMILRYEEALNAVR